MKSIEDNPGKKPWITSLLVLLTLFTLFIAPLFGEQWSHRVYPVAFSAIFICAAFALDRHRHALIWISIVLVVITAISSFAAEGSFKTITRSMQFIFFVVLVGALIRQISTSPVVSKMVIMEAVTAYLLLGFAFGIMVLMADNLLQGAYSESFKRPDALGSHADISTAFYYAFVTYSTTGYGDITPRHPVTKSLAMLISISGQLYVAVILALLVGKFASRSIEITDKS